MTVLGYTKQLVRAAQKLPIVLRTARHLRMSQIWHRARLTWQRRREAMGGTRVAHRTRRRVVGTSFNHTRVRTVADSIEHRNTTLVDELQQGKLTLLNKQRDFSGQLAGWCMSNKRVKDSLWNHTIHYHGWIHELALAHANDPDSGYDALVDRYVTQWLDLCGLGQPGFGKYAWNSYAIATRIDNWRQMYAVLPDSFWQARPQLYRRFQESLSLQGQYLYEHLEWDLRGNHLWRDALGLASAGRMVNGPQAGYWLRRAYQLAIDQIDEQVLPDGGHFERSPLYHLECMRDLLKLIQLAQDSPTQRMRETWSKMAEHVLWLRHPDGTIPLFNDAAVCRPDDVLGLGAAIGCPVDMAAKTGGKHFPDTGIVVWQGTPWTVFFDVGEIAASYQPGHAHADTLSFECSVDGQRLFIDPGCHSYDDDETRRYDRSTLAHNTICIDEMDSSEVWHVFRVGRRAHPRDVKVEFGSNFCQAEARHDGYEHLAGKPCPWRIVTVEDNGDLVVLDRIDGSHQHRVKSGLLLEPSWSVQAEPDGWRLQKGDIRVRVQVGGAAGIRLVCKPRPYHPSYGVEIEARQLQIAYEGPLPIEIRMLIRVE